MPLTTCIKEQTPKYTFSTRVMENPSNYKKSERRTKTTLLKRIPLHRLMDLKIDYAFKQLFGNEKNKDIMVVFLNAILQRTGSGRIKDFSFLNIEAGGEYVDDKQTRLDLLVITDNGERINVEIQFTNKYDMIKRSIYYWAGIYRSPLKSRMSYKELRTVISINILNFTLFDETEHFHTTYHLYEDEERFQLTDVMEFHYIEITKLLKAWKKGKLDPWNDVLARWLLMLGMVDHRNDKVYQDIYRGLEGIAMKDETLKNAFQNWEELSMTQEEFLAYESRLKHILDEEAARREMELWRQELESRERELESHIQEAESRIEDADARIKDADSQIQEAELMRQEVKRQVARRLLSMEMDIDKVVKATELSKGEVVRIHTELLE